MNTSRLRVLIAEDDVFSQKLLAEMLKDSAIGDVHFAGSGEEVLAKIDSELNPDIILCDLNMPGVDGIDLLRMLGDRQFVGEIIIISGCDKRIIKAACQMAVHYKLNLVGGLEKPVDATRLERLISYCGESKQLFVAPKKPLKISPLEVKDAIENSHILPYFQPQVDIHTGVVVGVECLARWQHPTKGLLLPDDFISLIAEYDLMSSFNDAMFVAALKAFRVLYDDCGIPTMSFNIAPACLQKGDLASRYHRLVKSEGFEAKDIVIEVLESDYQEGTELPLAVLNHFRLKGFGLSVDDFGTGYSSLERVSQVHVSGIKIDRRFVAEASDDVVACSIIRNTIHLAHELGVKTVAEGIEKMEDWTLMRDLGCDYIQGFLVARPKVASQIKIWVEHWNKVMNETVP